MSQRNAGGALGCCIAAIAGSLALRAITWYFFDNSPLYTMVVVFVGIVAAVAYFGFMVAAGKMLHIVSLPKLIVTLDNLSYEFYLTQALFISGVTSLVGIWGRHPVEILLFLVATIFTSFALQKVVTGITMKG